MRRAAALGALAAWLLAAPAHACACCADAGAYHVMELDTARLDLEGLALEGSLSAPGETDPPADLHPEIEARFEGKRLVVALADRNRRPAGRIVFALPPVIEAEVADSRYYAAAPAPAGADATVLIWRLRAEGHARLEALAGYRPADEPARFALFLRGNHCLDLGAVNGWLLALTLVDGQGNLRPFAIGGPTRQ